MEDQKIQESNPSSSGSKTMDFNKNNNLNTDRKIKNTNIEINPTTQSNYSLFESSILNDISVG